MAASSMHVKMPKENYMPVPMRSGAADPVLNRNLNPHLSAFCSFAVGTFLACCLGPIQAADVPAAKPSAEPQGHQMRRYQAFARQAELPLIAITSETTLAVGTAVKIDISRLAQLPTTDVEALAGQFAVPVAVVAKVIQRLAANPALRATQLAQELRTSVVDYRFLQGEWGRYHPPQEGQQARTDALYALEAGDIAKAWVLYDGLGIPPAPAIAPPAPPTNLRIVANP